MYNIKQGVVVGVAIATLYAGAACLAFVLGSDGGRDGALGELAAIIAAYFVAGIGGGAVGGVLIPWRRFLPVALLTGVVAGSVAGLGFATAMEGPRFWLWDTATWISVAGVGLGLGGWGGYVYWRNQGG